MRKIKLIFAMLLALISLLGITSYAADDIKLYIDGSLVKTDVAPAVINSRTMVPVRSIFEELGADVTWIGSRKQVVIKSLSTRIVLNVDKTKAYVGEKAVELDVAPMTIDGRTLIPVRFVTENLGYDVEWVPKTNSVHINTPKKAEESAVIQKISVNTGKKSSTVVITVEDMKKPSVSYASSPLRFIADFPDTTIYGGDSKKRMNTSDITEVRYAEHEEYARVVIEVPGEAEFEVKYTSDSMIVTVTSTGTITNTDTVKGEGEDDDQEYKDDEDVPTSVKPQIIRPIDPDNPIVVIDAGHGGWDTGAVAYDEDGEIIVAESDANLSIALSTQKYLENEGINVIMTRTTDVALGTTEMEDLQKRSAIANEVGAALFVSIHNNSFSNETATGTEILYVSGGVQNQFGINGEILAQNILTPLVQTTELTNRGLKNSPKIVVLRETLMPAVLVECAFISNPEDRKLLTNRRSLDDIGYSIASGILETISEFK